MNRITTFIAVCSAFLMLLIIDCYAADQRLPVTKQPNVGSPPTYATPPPRSPANGVSNGAVIQGNQIHALPGYSLQPAPNNQLMLRSNGGGAGLGASFYGCGCVGGTGGTCTVSTDGKDSGSCYKGSNDTCTGECKFETVTIPQGGLMAR